MSRGLMKFIGYVGIFVIVGLGLGLLIGRYMAQRANDPSGIEWELVTSLPFKPVSILAVETDALVLEGEEAQVLRCGVSAEGQSCEPVDDYVPADTVPSEGECLPLTDIPAPPGVAVSRFDQMTCFPEGQVQLTYVLLQDDTVWVWRQASSAFAGTLVISCPMVCMAVALFVGIFTGVRLLASGDGKSPLADQEGIAEDSI